MSDITTQPTEKKTPWFRTRAAAVWGLLLVGPFALPILWYCRAFSTRAKVVITLLVVVLTCVSYVYTPILIDQLSSKLQEVQTLAKS